MATGKTAVRPGLAGLLAETKAGCTNCGVCVGSCAFLKKKGTPGEIAGACDPDNQDALRTSFQCSLCGLCSQLCPERLDLDGMFLEMRREAVERGFGDFREHAPLLAYERAGTSRRFSLYRLPEGCSSVFFPGCSLSGTRPDAVKRTFAELRKLDPAAGIVFDCCLKPSHSLGRERYVNAMFDEMAGWLLRQGVKEVLVACPNCQVMFEALGRELRVSTVWERLAESGIPLAPASGTVTVHDPCVLRKAPEVHQAVRDLLRRQGVTVEEMPHSGERTLCCGKGGAVDMLDPALAGSWGELREREAAGRRTITYCAGCVQALGARTPTSHLVDMLFSPEETMAGRKKGAGGLLTYANRLLLKRSCKKKEGFVVTRERNDTLEEGKRRKSPWQPVFVIALITAAIAGIRLSGASEYLQQDHLRSLIASYGTLAPFIYVLIYSLAPVLFLPALPLTLVGGIVFGPFWGVVYTIVGATIGASFAFLVARYAARDWVASRLAGPKWARLDGEVAQHGWKVVAFTRLIPAFPFNLLNYAFGLTKIRFAHYVLVSFLCMLPATVAFIVFSSSLLDLFSGRVSPAALAGVVLVLVVILAPVCYRRRKARLGGLAATE